MIMILKNVVQDFLFTRSSHELVRTLRQLQTLYWSSLNLFATVTFGFSFVLRMGTYEEVWVVCLFLFRSLCLFSITFLHAFEHQLHRVP